MLEHGIPPRQPTPQSLKSPANKDPGLFGRMFPDLKPLNATDAALEALADAMVDTGPANNPNVPAGFTYLGQFVDHDITFDPTSLGEKVNDPDAKENFRSPALDLDSVYGLGPSLMPYLYERDPVTLKTGPRLLIGTAAKSSRLVPPNPNATIPDQVGHDLPRNPLTGIAIIGDPRNDENLIVAQLHVAFLRFHNNVVDKLKADGVPDGALFNEARKLVTWHYQWIVLHEFLEKLTGEKGIAERIMKKGRKFYRFKKWPFMPVEFAVAAYRLGHSMVRDAYSHNFVFRLPPGGAAIPTLNLLFDFTAKSGRIVGALQPPGAPQPQPVLPSNWVIDWRRFFDFNTPAGTPNFQFNFAQPLDPLITKTLHTLPGEDPATPDRKLPFRNLKRGVMMKLPSGQAIAKAMRIAPMKLSDFAKGSGGDGAVAKKHGFDKQTPLWYYILKEAEQLGGSQHLGPVGATIVAEVFVGLVQGSANSYLGASTPFKPLFGATSGDFTMVDLLKFAEVVNPLGDG